MSVYGVDSSIAGNLSINKCLSLSRNRLITFSAATVTSSGWTNIDENVIYGVGFAAGGVWISSTIFGFDRNGDYSTSWVIFKFTSSSAVNIYTIPSNPVRLQSGIFPSVDSVNTAISGLTPIAGTYTETYLSVNLSCYYDSTMSTGSLLLQNGPLIANYQYKTANRTSDYVLIQYTNSGQGTVGNHSGIFATNGSNASSGSLGNATNGVTFTGLGDQGYSIFSKYGIACGQELSLYSDKRIKCNIQDISGESAIQLIRKISPSTYNYVDYIKNGNTRHYGFIAQDVQKVIPTTVNTTQEFIPNIYDIGAFSDANTICLQTKSTSLFDLSNTTLQIYVGEEEKKVVNLDTILDDHSFTIQEKMEDVYLDKPVFVYGQKIPDFLMIEKNAIFTITTAAVKEMDIQIQELKETVQKQQLLIERLLSKIESI
jgi:hypothetical protein